MIRLFLFDVYMTAYLVLIGFTVGILSGFFGFGGGFIITPFLFTIGVPMNVAIGTSIAQILGTSVIATMRHRTLKHVDVKLGAIVAVGSIVGVNLGVHMVEFFKGISIEALDISVGLTYILVLGFISVFMSYESLRSKRSNNPSSKRTFTDRIQRIRIPPMISLPQSNINSISLWIILFVGFIAGVLAGFMGAGGGFIQMPSLIYIVGCETTIAVGTNLFAMLIAGVYAAISHSLRGNVDVVLAAVMLIGSSVGAKIGVSATKHVKGANLRLIFGLSTGLISLSVFLEMVAKSLKIHLLSLISQGVLVLTIASVAVLIIILTLCGLRGDGCGGSSEDGSE